MEWISLGRTAELLHVVSACALVGGQLLITVAAWRRPPAPDTAQDAALGRFERLYRLFALVAVLLTTTFGLWLLRYTLVSDLLLVSTPYGPALGVKVCGTLAFTAYLLLAPPLLRAGAHPTSDSARRMWSLVGALIVVGVVAVSTSLRYL